MQASPTFVTAMLFTYGVGLTAGNGLGGRFADRSVDRTLIVALALRVGAEATDTPKKAGAAVRMR